MEKINIWNWINKAGSSSQHIICWYQCSKTIWYTKCIYWVIVIYENLTFFKFEFVSINYKKSPAKKWKFPKHLNCQLDHLFDPELFEKIKVDILLSLIITNH